MFKNVHYFYYISPHLENLNSVGKTIRQRTQAEEDIDKVLQNGKSNHDLSKNFNPVYYENSYAENLNNMVNKAETQELKAKELDNSSNNNHVHNQNPYIEKISNEQYQIEEKQKENQHNNANTNKNPSNSLLAPYRNHPLLNYIKQNHPLIKPTLLTFRSQQPNDPNAQNQEATSTLILKPVARAIAGPEGKAMATPLSRAVLRRNSNVDILFEPDSVAIAGPGGIAHAESDLEITYVDED